MDNSSASIVAATCGGANVQVFHARDRALGNQDHWADTQAYALYERCLATQQFEMAAHVLRYHMLDLNGGVFFDVKDDLMSRIDFDRVQAAPDEILHGGVRHDEMPRRQYIDNNPIATRPANKLIKKLLAQIGENFADHVRRESTGQATALTFEKPISRATFHLFCGAGLFSNVVTSHDVRSEAVGRNTRLLNSHPDIVAHTPFHVTPLRGNRLVCLFESGNAPFNQRSLGEEFRYLAIDEPRGLGATFDHTNIRRDSDGCEYQRVGGRTYRIDPESARERPVVLTPDGFPTDIVVASRRHLETRT